MDATPPDHWCPTFRDVRLKRDRVGESAMGKPGPKPAVVDDDPMPEAAGSPRPLEDRCAAKLRKSDQRFGMTRYCTEFPIQGRNRCRLHGGKTLRGVAHPGYKHGRSSRYASLAPKPFRDLMEAAQGIGDPASVVDEIDLLKGRVGQLFQEVWDGLNLDRLSEIDRDLDQVRATLERVVADDLTLTDDATAELLEDVEEIYAGIEGALEAHTTWDKLLLTIEQLRKTADSETRRAYLRSKTVSADDLQELLGAFVRAINDEFLDDEVLVEVTGREVKRRFLQRVQQVFYDGKAPPPQP